MKLGAIDVEHSTRVLTLPEAWTFIMEKLDGLETISVNITAQDWKADEHDPEWLDTFRVTVCGRQTQPEGATDA